MYKSAFRGCICDQFAVLLLTRMLDLLALPSHVLQRILDLPPAETRDIIIEPDLRVPMADGVVLLADLMKARHAGPRPLILMRSPYGRNNFFMQWLARPFAERGFHVLIQSCRGTFGSQGTFDPFRTEKDDGRDTLAWLAKQPWFSGDIATYGPSYLGFVQWALAKNAGPMLKAMSVQITTTNFRTINYPGESFTFDAMLRWTYLVHGQEKRLPGLILNRLLEKRTLERGFSHQPLNESDEAITGRKVPFFQDWLKHNTAGDPWWDIADHTETPPEVAAPVLFVAGFYDIFLPYQLRDYAAMVDAGKTPYLTIGPWSHSTMSAFGAFVRESLAWFRAQLLNDRSLLREAPVRIFVMGANEWRDYSSWPPPGVRSVRYHLQPNGALGPEMPPNCLPDRYKYDPANPTPSVGGALLSQESGPHDNRKLETRADVLTYTTPPLDQPIDVIGPLSAELFVQSSVRHTDFFVRLCDVEPSGRSINISDGIFRVFPGHPDVRSDGTWAVTVELWPTAYRFKKGHSLRLQVSSGAHPRFVRNPGSGEPLATAKKLFVANQSVHHDPEHPSAIVLSILD